MYLLHFEASSSQAKRNNEVEDKRTNIYDAAHHGNICVDNQRHKVITSFMNLIINYNKKLTQKITTMPQLFRLDSSD